MELGTFTQLTQLLLAITIIWSIIDTQNLRRRVEQLESNNK